jgi:aminopeptidase N
MLRDHVVGRESFDRAFKTYIDRWAFKHPTPADFFRTIENVTGTDLSWYWRSFFYGTDILDIGIDSVQNDTSSQGEHSATVVLTKHTSVPFPVEMRLALADGSTQNIKLPVDIWFRTDHYAAVIPVKASVVGVRLWPDQTVPDLQPRNDTWGKPPAPDPLAPATTGGLATPIQRR